MLIKVVEEAHARGMHVILDGVFNHCGSFNKWMDRERIYENQPGYEKGAYVSADSPYRSFFKFNNEYSWPYNSFYDGWWGHETLPKLAYEQSPKLVAVHHGDRTEMGVTAVQPGRMASGRGGRPWFQ